MTVILYVDGGTRGSIICLVDPKKRKTIVKYRSGRNIKRTNPWDFGEWRLPTNNQLEYLAMIYGIEYAKNKYPKDTIILKSDSMVVVNQLNMIWNVHSGSLTYLFNKTINKLKGTHIRPSWTPRENNLAGIHLESLKDTLKWS